MNYLSPKLSIFYAISGLLNIIIIENHSPKQYTYYYNESNVSSTVFGYPVYARCFTCLLVYLFRKTFKLLDVRAF